MNFSANTSNGSEEVRILERVCRCLVLDVRGRRSFGHGDPIPV